jgi:ABC-type transporter Mla MlaB component
MLQKLVSSRNLQQMLDAGWRPAEQHVERIDSEVLALLVYLQQQQVSAIHVFESVSLHCHHLQLCSVHVIQKLDTSLLFRSIYPPNNHAACQTIHLLCTVEAPVASASVV